MITIDGQNYNVPVLALKRSADFLDKYAERTEDGRLHRELVGVYHNYQLELGMTADADEYQRLWDKLTQASEYHTVTVPNHGESYSFTAYFDGVSDQLLLEKGERCYFDGLTVNFIARSPKGG